MDKFPSRERTTSLALEPRVSAIVVTRDTGRSLEPCLRSALAEPWIDEVVIVDGGNPPEVSSGLRALCADRRDVRLVASPREASLGAAANEGAKRARGRWLLFLDPHVVVQRGAAARLAAAGGAAHAPWIVGGQLTDINGKVRRAARRGSLNVWSALAVAINLPSGRIKKKSSKRGRDNPEPTKVAAVSGAFMLIPRRDFQDLQGFDEGFLGNGADLDLCRRAKDSGGVILFEPAASGVQFVTRNSRRREAQGLARFASKSARTPIERAFAALARPAISVILLLRDFVVGVEPTKR